MNYSCGEFSEMIKWTKVWIETSFGSYVKKSLQKLYVI